MNEKCGINLKKTNHHHPPPFCLNFAQSLHIHLEPAESPAVRWIEI
jgi:hypothetical protein